MSADRLAAKRAPERLIGLTFVVLLHAAALWGLWQHRLLPSPAAIETLFVHFIAPPAPDKVVEPKRPPPRPRQVEKPQPRQLVAETPMVAAIDYIAPPPAPKPEPAIEAPRLLLPPGPVPLGTELALACPDRTPPQYPALARRFGETGRVILRVELDEQGLVASARIENSSGHERLDLAALAAVKSWRCNPPRRNGEPTRAVARQPFHFVLQGN
ncbi:MAG: energy transducer TonB [Sulfuritalea sp.]|nr:energy transducer TonB [Sulfuritalea sp.]